MNETQVIIMIKKIVLGLSLMMISLTSSSAGFWHHAGVVTRTLTEGPNYGGCMIKVSKLLPVQCSVDGKRTNWISLDCQGTYYSDGPRKYATALAAMTTNLRVSLWIDDTKKHTGHCVARRMDVYKETTE